jgi:3',5'-cyclic AMP phosphodiesterase CpdA
LPRPLSPVTELAHVSDLHFGTELPQLERELRAVLSRKPPTLLVISGDLTQRARVGQFRAARRSLDQMPQPRLVIPGNHDQPLWNVFRRALSPLGRYHRFITRDMAPVHETPDAIVLGLDTTCRWVWKCGCVRQEHLETLRRTITNPDDHRVRVIVTHHPFLPAPGAPSFASMYGRVGDALGLLRAHGPAVLLAGHLHLGDTGGIHATESGSLLAIQAGTAISHRVRAQTNTFNWISIDHESLTVVVRHWNGETFVDTDCQRYLIRRRTWTRVE